MQDYDKNPVLKQAISGYMSYVSYIIKKQQLEQMLTGLVLYRLQQQMQVFAKLALYFSKPAMKAVAKDFFGYEFVQDLIALMGCSSVNVEEQLRVIFESKGIDVLFLKKHNISLLEFSRFIIALVDLLTIKQKQGEMPETLKEQQAFIEQKAKLLIRTRYVRLERIICCIPVFVQQVGGYRELCSLAIEIKRVVAVESLQSVDIERSSEMQQAVISSQPQALICYTHSNNHEVWELAQRRVELP